MFQPELLNKEARFGLPRGALGDKVHRSQSTFGKAVEGDQVVYRSPRQMEEGLHEQSRQDGNGMIADGALWGLNLLTPKSWDAREKILKPLDKMKNKMGEASTAAAGKIIGDRPDKSFVAKMFSTPQTTLVGKERLADGTVRDLAAVDRKASLTAPLENISRKSAPLLASFYLGGKMYPTDAARPPDQEGGYKAAFESNYDTEKNGLEDELLVERLDKQAALDKVVHLEGELEKMASDLEQLAREKQAFWNKAESEAIEKSAALKEKRQIEKELLEKTAAFEEHRLRTIAQARSGNAVKVAETMLERGIIKQAEFVEKVDFLMDCDDRTFNLHSSIAKAAETDEKGLETSAFFIDYRDKDEESSPHRSGRGLSKKGQTIGEAAKDLNK